MRKAVVDEASGAVNIVVADDGFDPGPGKRVLDADGAIQGGTWDGTRFLPPPEKLPLADPDAELLDGIAAARAAVDAAGDLPALRAAVMDLCAALSGERPGQAGRVAGKPL